MGQWIVGVISFQKMYGLYGLKHHIVEKSGDVTDPDGQTTRKDRATQLLICEKLSLAIPSQMEVAPQRTQKCLGLDPSLSSKSADANNHYQR